MVRRTGRTPSGKGPSKLLRYVCLILFGSLFAIVMFVYSMGLPTPELQLSGFAMVIGIFAITFGGTVICTYRDAKIEIKGPKF